ncbi:CBU_0592 family membrane protein [Paucidesulfovibrio longus]|uniref:CBU_0592 family membrane protein n=1 Tax=Paucidesulfovibrio longus TaxID=889 RepID=UPI0003B4E5FE|nr:hypothetical protein [Paucidesulfovibrio longus]
MEYYDVIGLTGSSLIILAYFLLQVEKLRSNSITYSAVNLLGALFILYSLCFEFNLAAAFIEGVWTVISIIGIWKGLRSRRASARERAR